MFWGHSDFSLKSDPLVERVVIIQFVVGVFTATLFHLLCDFRRKTLARMERWMMMRRMKKKVCNKFLQFFVFIYLFKKVLNCDKLIPDRSSNRSRHDGREKEERSRR